MPYWFQQDAFSLALDDTLSIWGWHTLSFFIKHKFPPNLSGFSPYLSGRLSVGMSHYSDSFGVVIDTTAYTDTAWTQQSIHFQATSNFGHITCRPVREIYGRSWVFVDNFVLRFDSTGTINPSWHCLNNACIDPSDGSGIYTSLATCQTSCITSTNELPQQQKQLVKIIDILGKEAMPKHKEILFYIYSDGTVEKKLLID